MLLQQLVSGLTIGSTYALVAIGYSLIFSVLELINFANGSLYMLGGYITLMIYLSMKANFFLALFISLIIAGIIGFSVDIFALRPLRKKKAPRKAYIISTLGVGIIIDNSIQLLFGSETKRFPNILDFGKFEIAGAIVSWTQVIIFVISVVLMALISLVVYKTKIGKAMRSTAQNIDTSRLMGVNVQGVIAFTFFISSVLAAIAATLISMYYQTVDVNMGFQVGMKTFAAAVLGGVGIMPGAMFGGIIIGILESLGASYISSGYRDAIAFAVLILVLLFKPEGIFGKPQIDKL